MTQKKTEKPTIELYMYSLHQEFPEGISHDSFLKRQVETKDLLTASGDKLRAQKVTDNVIDDMKSSWPAKWIHAKWLTDHTKAITSIYDRPDISPIEMAMTRPEAFGGIIFDPFSDKVYKVNESGLKLFRQLQDAAKGGANLMKFTSSDFAKDDIKEFCIFLRGADLWLR